MASPIAQQIYDHLKWFLAKDKAKKLAKILTRESGEAAAIAEKALFDTLDEFAKRGNPDMSQVITDQLATPLRLLLEAHKRDPSGPLPSGADGPVAGGSKPPSTTVKSLVAKIFESRIAPPVKGASGPSDTPIAPSQVPGEPETRKGPDVGVMDSKQNLLEEKPFVQPNAAAAEELLSASKPPVNKPINLEKGMSIKDLLRAYAEQTANRKQARDAAKVLTIAERHPEIFNKDASWFLTATHPANPPKGMSPAEWRATVKMQKELALFEYQTHAAAMKGERDAIRTSLAESRLQQVQRAGAVEKATFEELSAKLKAGTITPPEHKALLGMMESGSKMEETTAKSTERRAKAAAAEKAALKAEQEAAELAAKEAAEAPIKAKAALREARTARVRAGDMPNSLRWLAEMMGLPTTKPTKARGGLTSRGTPHRIRVKPGLPAGKVAMGMLGGTPGLLALMSMLGLGRAVTSRITPSGEEKVAMATTPAKTLDDFIFEAIAAERNQRDQSAMLQRNPELLAQLSQLTARQQAANAPAPGMYSME